MLSRDCRMRLKNEKRLDAENGKTCIDRRFGWRLALRMSALLALDCKESEGQRLRMGPREIQQMCRIPN